MQFSIELYFLINFIVANKLFFEKPRYKTYSTNRYDTPSIMNEE